MKTFIVSSMLLLFMQSSITTAHESEDLHRISFFTYGGAPVCKSSSSSCAGHKVLVNTAYAVGYSDELKNPVWAVYRLGNEKGNTAKVKCERPDFFRVDTRTQSKVSHGDYTSSGYDRGHLAPNAAMLNQYGHIAQLETYLMSNIIPQHRDLNRGIWQQLESKVRDDLSQDDTNNDEIHDLFVITGPLFKYEINEQNSTRMRISKTNGILSAILPQRNL